MLFLSNNIRTFQLILSSRPVLTLNMKVPREHFRYRIRWHRGLDTSNN